MEDWLASLTNIPTAIEKTVVADFSEYGLSPSGVRYTIRFSPKPEATPWRSIEFGTNKSGQVFERRTDEDFVNTIGRDDFGRLPQVSWQLRDRRIWSFDSSNVLSVTIHQQGVTRKYLRDPDGEWTFAPGFHGPPFINSFSLEEGVHRIGKLTAIYWDGAGDDSLRALRVSPRSITAWNSKSNARTASRFYKSSLAPASPYLHPYASVVAQRAAAHI